MPRLSVTIITKNEAAQIEGAIASVAWADEILIVDSHSADDTVSRARSAGARVIVRDWPGYVAQKNFAASEAAHDWILSIDADERVTPELAASIRRVLEEPAHAAYGCPRVTWYLGKWITGTDWSSDVQTRLYDRRSASWSGELVHESLAVRGSRGVLAGDLHHYAYRDIGEHLDTIDRYTTLAARQMFDSGRRATAAQIVLQPPFAFLRNYIAKGGFRLGTVGFIVSALNTYYVFLKFARLWELQHRTAAPPPHAPDTR